MKKKTTLPKEFNELVEAGDIEVLKAVFTKCEANAITSKYGPNAFGVAPLYREFALWLKEQGGDVNLKDYYGDTPIFKHASSYKGDVPLLIELGADINIIGRSGNTPLHTASTYGRIVAVEALLKNGAIIDALAENPISKTAYTPLEMMLVERRLQADMLLSVSKMLMGAGAKISDTAKNAVIKIGENFEFYKSRQTDKENAAKQQAAMDELYVLFGVEPVKPVVVHDGVSPIVVKGTDFEKDLNLLWQYLVPASGCANTAQGEVFRITERVSHEIRGNGGINWDKDYRSMLNMLPQYFRMGTPLADSALMEVDKLIRAIYDGNGDEEPVELQNYALAWIYLNEAVIAVIPPNYKR